MVNSNPPGSERRKYVRMDTVFPVEMVLRHPDRPAPSAPLQGFTRNVSLGGLFLEFRSLPPAEAAILESRQASLELLVHVPFLPKPYSITSHTAWLSKKDEDGRTIYQVGAQYDAAESWIAKRIMRYARIRRMLPRVFSGTVLLLIAVIIGLTLNQLHLVRENRRLVGSIVESAVTGSEATDQTREEILDQLVTWLERHANAHSGLVPSYEGDPKLEQMSYTYDQALTAIVFALVRKEDAAKKILSFYKDRAEKSDGGFVSAYDAPSGKAVEWNLHVGPNIWIGIAALQYQRLTGDSGYLGMAQSIGNWLLELQALDPEHGLRGGPKVEWFSTEHNLDAYAYFGMLGKVTGDPRYLTAREEIYSWLLKHAADRKAGVFLRGKGDSTIATDTFSWSIAAIGPERLLESKFDPEGIMDFAEAQCRVEVNFDRPDGRSVKVTGFDFAKPQNQGRGGIVSTEWTAQAVVTFGILKKYFEAAGNTEKSTYYLDKSNFYLNELQKMIISSLSRVGQGHGCLPYATAANVETGHGWRTPNGNRTGSVAGTAYGIFAWKGFNPFDDNQQ